MPIIVGVHGIAQQLEGKYNQEAIWFPALRSGLELAGVQFPNPGDYANAFYGDAFRSSGKGLSTTVTLGVGTPPYEPRDVDHEIEQDLLNLWWAEAYKT